MLFFDTLLENSDCYALDLFHGFMGLFDFNEDESEIETRTQAFIVKAKNDYQDNLDQLIPSQQHAYLEQLERYFGKPSDAENSDFEFFINIIQKKRLLANSQLEANDINFNSQFNNTHKHLEISAEKGWIKLIEPFPYYKYWDLVKSETYRFVSSTLGTLRSHELSEPAHSATKYELQFFEYLEKVKSNFDISSVFDLESDFHIDSDPGLYYMKTNFKNEIIEKATSMTDCERTYYLNRLTTRLKETFDKAFVLNEMANRSNDFNLSDVTESDDITQYNNALKLYKGQLLALIENLNHNTSSINPGLTEPSLYPCKQEELLVIKKILFSKSPTEPESDAIWLSRFVNDQAKLESIFPDGKGAGRNGNEYTEAKIWQAALIDLIKERLKEVGCIGRDSRMYFITKWGIDKFDTFISNRESKVEFATAKTHFQTLLQ
jgi:hypothetical protein